MVVFVAIPVGIASIALAFLWDRYDEFANYFFTSLEIQEQIALLALLFAVLFAAIGVSQVLIPVTTDTGSSSSSSSSNDDEDDDRLPTDDTTTLTIMKPQHPSKIQYPLHEMNLALSDRSKFASLYPWLRDSMLETLQQQQQQQDIPESAMEYLMKMMDYTVMGGKFHRGTTVITVYRVLQQRSLTALEMAHAATLGWTVEFLQAFFLVADDVMDQSTTRRGQACWYQLDDVQFKAINDAFLLESLVFTIAKTHFRHLSTYRTMVELLLEVIQKTALGQLLDLQMPSKDGSVDFSFFTLARYQSIVRYKTAYYSFYLPVALAMALAGIQDPQAYQMTQEICCLMGEYFQIQDDVMDCFGGDAKTQQPSTNATTTTTPSSPTSPTSSPSGSDIQDNKCSWLIVQALIQCNDQQRQVLQDNYGQPDDTKVQKVKQLYQDLGLLQAFQTYQEESYAQIQRLVQNLEQKRIMPAAQQVFQMLLKKIYKKKRIIHPQSIASTSSNNHNESS